MDIRHLRCFLAVSDFLNFTKAAHQLCLTQSAVSYQISALERELGVKLFTRAPNSVHFTPEGQHFYDGLKGVMATYEGLVASTRRLASGQTHSLEVGFLGGVEKRILPPLVKRFRERYPWVALRFNRFDIVPLGLALEKGELDVAFALAVGLPSNSGLRSQLLYRERLVVVMQADHPLAGAESLAWEDLQHMAFVDLEQVLNAPTNALLVQICEKRGFTPRIVERFSGLESLFMAVESGEGIAVFPKYRAEAHLNPRLTYVPLVGEDSTTDCVVAWKQTGNPALQAFLRELGVRA